MSDRELHVRIRRLTIDESAMPSASTKDLRAQLEASLSQRLASGVATPASPPVAQIVDAVAARTTAAVPQMGGANARP